MWQTELLRDVMKEYVERRTYTLYLPAYRNIEDGPLKELADLSNDYRPHKNRPWYNPRVEINKENYEEAVDLLTLATLNKNQWAEKQMRSFNKLFKDEFHKALYLKRRRDFDDVVSKIS